MFKKLKCLIFLLLLSALESHATFCVPDRPPEISSRISSPTSHPTFAHFALFVVSSSSDPSGSLQGAGGVGGLLCVIDGRANPQGEPYFPCFDANGNIVQYIDDEGNIVAAREYSPFGETTSVTGSMQDDFTFWFSTKYWDNETGLGYWGMRYYHPEQGRWLSRDPLGEEGGLLLYGFVGNDPMGGVDPLGLWALDENTAIAEKDDTLSDLAQILVVDWGEFEKQGVWSSGRAPESLQIGEGIDVSHWLNPLRDTIAYHEYLSEGLLGLRLDKMAFEDAIRACSDESGRYDPVDVSRAAREQCALYEKVVAAAGLIETSAELLRVGESARRMYVAHLLAKATDRQKLALQVVEAAKTGRAIKITKAGVVLGALSASFDAHAAGQAFGQGNIAEGARRSSTAGVAVWGIWFPPAAIAGGIYALGVDPLLSYTIGGGAIDRRTRRSIVENDMLYYHRMNRLTNAVSGHLQNLEPEVQRANRIFQEFNR